MDQEGIGRREFFTSIGSLAMVSGVGISTGDSKQTENTGKPDFGFPIEESWNIDHGQSDASLGAVRDNYVYISFKSFNTGGEDSESEIVRVNRFTGETNWSRTIDDYVYGPYEAGGRVLFAGNNTIQCWNATTGEEIWKKSLPNDFISLHEVLDERVYVIGYDVEQVSRSGESVYEVTGSTLNVFAPEDGAVKWRTRSSHALWATTDFGEQVFLRENQSHFSNNEVVYEDGQLIALDTADGTIDWTSDWINPKFLNEENEVLVTLTENNDLFTFEPDGHRRWMKEDAGYDYYITDEFLIVARLGGGISVFDHSGTELISEPLYPSVDISIIRSGPSADPLFLGSDDEIIAIDGDDFTEQWRTSLPASPESISAQREVVFITSDESSIQALNSRTGNYIWEDHISGAESLSMNVRDGLLYVSGTEAPLRAYSGRRGRAMIALKNAKTSEETIGGRITGLLGWREYISRAETAIEEGRYEKAHRLLDRGERRRHLMQGVLGATGIGTAYGTSRAGAKRWKLRQLQTVIERLETLFPISDGELAGAEPTDLLGQARFAKKSIKSSRSPKLRDIFSNDYTNLLQRLNQVADLHSDLVDASTMLSEVEQTYLLDSWMSELRKAVEAGDVNQINDLLDRISMAETHSDQLDSLYQTVSASSLTVSTSHLADLLESEIANSNGAIEGWKLAAVFRTLEGGVDAYESQRESLSMFDLDPMVSTLERVLQNSAKITSQKLQQIGQYEALFSAAASVEQRIADVEFAAVNPSRDNYKQQARSLFANYDSSGLQELATELDNLQAGP